MQHKSHKKSVYNVKRNATSEDLVCQRISNHNRCILNAKKAYDSSPSYCYKPRRSISSFQNSAYLKTNKQKKPLRNRNISPALTERSLSNNSFKESCWGSESCAESHKSCAMSCPHKHHPNTYSCFNMELIDRITYDTKNGPAAYCDEGWMEIKAQHNDNRYILNQRMRSSSKTNSLCSVGVPKNGPRNRSTESHQKRRNSFQKKVPSSSVDNLDKNQFFSSHKKNFHPRILKTEAVSKLRSLRVYYPPRRKETRKKNEKASSLTDDCSLESTNHKYSNASVYGRSGGSVDYDNSPKNAKEQNKASSRDSDLYGSSIETRACKCTSICICESNDFKKSPQNAKEQSQTSSRDSAYNGGVSSVPDSRSPTPDQRVKKCLCADGNITAYYCKEKSAKKFEEIEDKPLSLKEKKIDIGKYSPLRGTYNPEENRKMREEERYLTFIQNITVEILEKCLYTNKALKKVMKRHVINNLNTLDKNRMLKEVDNLRVQLGIPEDKNFLNLSIDIEDSSSSLINMCPVISDSEFKLPEELSESGKKKEDKSIRHVYGFGESARGDSSQTKSLRNDEESIKIMLELDSGDDFSSSKSGEKFVRDKRKGKNPSEDLDQSRGNSADESDQSFDHKIKTRSHGLKKQTRKYRRDDTPTYSSGSESEKSKHGHPGVPNKNTDEEFFPSSESLTTEKNVATDESRSLRNVKFRNKDADGGTKRT